MTDHTETDTPQPVTVPPVDFILEALAAGSNRGTDRPDEVQATVAELGSYAASMIVAAAHAEPMNKMADDLTELIHGSGRGGDTSRDNLSSTVAALAEAADDRLFAMIRNGETTAEIGGSYDRRIMYHRLARIRETLRSLDAAVGAAIGEFVAYAPDDAWPKDADPDAEDTCQAEEHAGD